METPLAAPSTPPARGALAALSLAVLLSSLGTSVANVLLPGLARAFDAPFQQVQWVVLAYLLAVTTLVVSAGRIGDLAGRRRLLAAGVALFTAASALCSLAPMLWLLIAARAAQGAGAAVMMALAMAMAGAAVPKDRTGSAMGLLGAMSAVGTALGPSLGGALMAAAGWRAVFAVIVPVGVVTWLLTQRYVPADGPASPSHWPGFDRSGMVALATALTAYALAMTVGHGRFGAINLVWLAVAAAAGLWFAAVERRAPSPLVRLAMLRDPVLSAGLAMSALVSTVMMATLVVGPFYLARALGLDAAAVGLTVAVGPVVAAVTGMPAGALADRYGAAWMTLVGLAVLAAGTVSLSLMPASLAAPGYIAAMVVITSGYALFQAANNTVVLRDVHPAQRGVTSGLLSLARNLGLVTGAAAMGAVFTAASGAVDVASAGAEAVAAGMHVTLGVASVLVGVALAGAADTYRRTTSNRAGALRVRPALDKVVN